MTTAFKPEFIERHRDIIPAEAMAKKIVIVGAGAIGSFVTLALAKMGYSNLHVIDFDTIDEANIGNQFYPINMVGKPKTMALAEMIHMFSGIKITALEGKLDEKSARINADIVISAVDSMAVRKLIYDLSDCYHLIDPRMGAEYAMMRVLRMAEGTKEEHADYTGTLYSDDEAVRERCTAKTTIYTVNLIAGQVVKAVKDITTSNKPITSLDWNIKANAMVAFSDGVKL
jgi:molybdopterin/thiamine biosynthesis adenylyltransferase